MEKSIGLEVVYYGVCVVLIVRLCGFCLVSTSSGQINQLVVRVYVKHTRVFHSDY